MGVCDTSQTPSSSRTPVFLHFPNSSGIVSCGGFSSWDYKAPCSHIFSLWQHATPTEMRVFCTASHTPSQPRPWPGPKRGSNGAYWWTSTSWAVKWHKICSFSFSSHLFVIESWQSGSHIAAQSEQFGQSACLSSGLAWPHQPCIITLSGPDRLSDKWGHFTLETHNVLLAIRLRYRTVLL